MDKKPHDVEDKLRSTDTVWHKATVTRQRRELHGKHKSILLWFTGLSGSGKSTLAHSVEERLHLMGCKTYVFDGDNVRHGLCADLGFSLKDREENIRRISEMCGLFLDAGVIALTAFISPSSIDRQKVKELIGEDYFEIYCECPIEVCEERDVKGLYKKARSGEIKNFTGISSPYDEPLSPNLVVDTSGRRSLDECVDEIVEKLLTMGVLPS